MVLLTKYEENILKNILFEFDFVKNKTQEDAAFNNCSDYFLMIMRRALSNKVKEFKNYKNQRSNKDKNEIIRITIPDFNIKDDYENANVTMSLMLELCINKHLFISKIKSGRVNSILLHSEYFNIELKFKNNKTGFEKSFKKKTYPDHEE